MQPEQRDLKTLEQAVGLLDDWRRRAIQMMIERNQALRERNEALLALRQK